MDCCSQRAPDATMLCASMGPSASLAASAQPQPSQGSFQTPINISTIAIVRRSSEVSCSIDLLGTHLPIAASLQLHTWETSQELSGKSDLPSFIIHDK